jgi:hypothetical protein
VGETAFEEKKNLEDNAAGVSEIGEGGEVVPAIATRARSLARSRRRRSLQTEKPVFSLQTKRNQIKAQNGQTFTKKIKHRKSFLLMILD